MLAAHDMIIVYLFTPQGTLFNCVVPPFLTGVERCVINCGKTPCRSYRFAILVSALAGWIVVKIGMRPLSYFQNGEQSHIFRVENTILH